MLSVKSKVYPGSISGSMPGQQQRSQGHSDATSRPSTEEAERKFEAMIVRQMIGSLVTGGKPTLGGGGPAAKIWQALLLDGIADQIARSGRVPLMPGKRDAATI